MTERPVLHLADGSRVQRGRILRSLPGKREVFAGDWQGRPVVVKVYLDTKRGAVHAQREADGLATFARADIRAPALLHHDVDQARHPVVIMQQIADGLPLTEAWQDESRRDDLTQRMMDVLAAHHRAGLQQADLHPGNFLVTDDHIYSLDGAAVEAHKRALDERASSRNLALYFAQFLPGEDARISDAAGRYARQRGWDAVPFSRPLPALVKAARLRRWEKLRPKLYRECSAVVHTKRGGYELFARRDAGAGLHILAADPDASLPADPAQWLKNGNTATVWGVDSDGTRVVVKRYNTKSRMHGLKQAAKESRASVSWRNAHMLRLFGVRTAEPLALVYGPKRRPGRSAYFIAGELPGTALSDWVARHADDEDAVARVAARMGRLLAQLHELQISHGDMKATNFLVDDGGEVGVIDLDAMQRHRFGRAFERAWQRDMKRFLANWQSDPAILAIMRDAVAPVLR